MANIKFSVLGAGVIGTTTALELQKKFPNADVTIIAEKFNRETTSDGAAGIFRPPTNFCISSEQISKTVVKESYQYYDDILRNVKPELSGVSQVSGYIFSTTSQSMVKNHLIEDIVPLYRKATEDELKLCPGTWKFGSFFETIITECRRYLPWSLTRFQKTGGKIVTQKIDNLKEFGHDYDVVINCLGLGAKEICDDKKIIPIRGQVLKVSAPWLKNFFYADYDTYIIPGLENVTLGGCRNFESYDCQVNLHDTASIWERCTALVPRLKNCEIEREWAGLRPYRDPVRLEIEIVKTAEKPLKIVHNYGHGGCGVTVAPGSAKHAVRLVEQILKANSKL